MSDWLDDLDTLPDLRTKPKAARKPKTPKPKGQVKRIAGETHAFIPVSLEQYNLSRPNNQRGFGGDITLPVFRRYLNRELTKAKYTPSHTLFLSPIWPEHLTINWNLT